MSQLVILFMTTCFSVGTLATISRHGVSNLQLTKKHILQMESREERGQKNSHIFLTLSHSISCSIGISEVTRHEISPIVGFQGKGILNPPEICAGSGFSTSRQITPLCGSYRGERSGFHCQNVLKATPQKSG